MSQISPSDYSIKEITHLQQACWLVFLPSSSLILTSPTGQMLCRLQSASLVQEAANQSQGSRSWWAVLACKVRGRGASWIVPWLHFMEWDPMSWESPLWLHQIFAYVYGGSTFISLHVWWEGKGLDHFPHRKGFSMPFHSCFITCTIPRLKTTRKRQTHFLWRSMPIFSWIPSKRISPLLALLFMGT